MKEILKYSLLISVLLFISCMKKIDYDKSLKAKVSSLNKVVLEGEPNNANIKKRNKDKEPDIYLYSGNKVPNNEYDFFLSLNKYAPIFYSNNEGVIEIIVLEPSDEKDTDEQINLERTLSPSVEFKDIEGKYYSIKDLEGKVVVLNFWFIGCPPCRKEIPSLNKLKKKFIGKNVVFFSITDDSIDELKEFLDSYILDFIHISDRTLAKKFGVICFPTNVIINKNSKIIFYESGGRKDIDLIMSPIIEECLSVNSCH